MSNTEIYVVYSTMGGYAHEDPDVAVIHGVFTDPEIANKVRIVCCARVKAIKLDEIKPGYHDSIQRLGL